MRKVVAIFNFLFILQFSLAAQNFISKLHCLTGYQFQINTSCVLNNKSTIVGGIYTKSPSILGTGFFLCKLDEQGELKWFKTFDNPFASAALVEVEFELSSFSGNRFILLLRYFTEQGKAFAMDENAEVLWGKNYPIYRLNDIEKEQSLAFAAGRSIHKIDYKGNKIWSEWIFRAIDEDKYNYRLTKWDDTHLLFSQNLGKDVFQNTPEAKINTFNLVVLNTIDGVLANKKLIKGPLNDTLWLQSVKVINDKVFIVGENGLTDKKFNVKGNEGFVVCLNKQFQVLWAKKIKLQGSSQNFGVDKLEELNDKNHILLNCHVGDWPFPAGNPKNRFIMARMNVNTGVIDSALYHDRVSYVDGNFQQSYAFSNGNTLEHIQGFAGNSFYFTSTNDFFKQNTCKNTSTILQSNNFNLSVEDDTDTVLNPETLDDVTVQPLSFNTLSFQTYNQCPECLCPTTDKKKVKICTNQSYALTSGKKVNTTGMYMDTIKTVEGCLRFVEIQLTANPFVETKLNLALCQATPSIKIAQKTYTTPGNYTDTLKTKAGCDSILLIHIQDLSNLSVSLGEDKELLEGEKLLLTAQTTPPDVIKQYTWFPSGTTTCDTCQSIEAVPTDNQWYAVLARQGECTASDTLLVRLIKEKTAYLPNAFSPNGDQNNDLFRPFCADVISNINAFEVFDRWGNLLYRKTDFAPNSPDIGWDGTYRGQTSDQGVYTYRVEVQLRSGKVQHYAGDVLLLR
jgi:gliding motility-associated-like protein